MGGGVQKAIDDLENAEYQDGPFENNLESARAYLLAQLQEKYGIEFTVVGDEDLENYGLFAGATYTCDVAPIDAPEQVATALVSQTMYQDVRDGYAVYFLRKRLRLWFWSCVKLRIMSLTSVFPWRCRKRQGHGQPKNLYFSRGTQYSGWL